MKATLLFFVALAAIAAAPLPCGAADAGGGPGPEAQARMIIKDIAVCPERARNDGTGEVTVSCTVFSPADNARVASVKADLRHTALGREIPLLPAAGRTLAPSGDGRYEGVIPICLFMDTGRYRVPIIAADSAGNRAAREASFFVDFAGHPGTPSIGSELFKKNLSFLAKSPLTEGNKVLVLASGPAALARRLAMIRNARKRIDLSSYTFDGSLAGGTFMDALTGAAARGVEVNVLLNADTQVPTGPLDTLRLYGNELAAELSQKARRKLEESSAPGLAALLPGPEFKGVKLVFFARADARAVSPDVLADHWLSRILTEKVPEAAVKALPEGMRERFTGPGGLPALPLLSHGLHEKILAVDGKAAVVGGRNLEDRYFTHWNDVDLYLEGPVVDEIRKAFTESFDDASGNKTAAPGQKAPNPAGKGPGATPVLFVHNLPWRKDLKTQSCLLYALSASNREAYLSSQFLALPDCLLADAIMDAARRGVDVRILTNSLETSRETSFAMGYQVSLNHMKKLMDAGVRIFTMKPDPDEKAPQPYLHAKQFILDEGLLAVGSFNLSVRSAYIESEDLAFVFDRDLARERREDFLATCAMKAEEMTPERLEAQSKSHRAAMEVARYLDLLF